MPTLNGITADPTTITPGTTSKITVDATAEPDKTYRIEGEVVGADPPQLAEVVVTLDNPPLSFSTEEGFAQPGQILLTTPDGGTLTEVEGQPGTYIFTP